MPGNKKDRMGMGEWLWGAFHYIRSIFGLNIGTAIFTTLLLYLIVSALLYMTSTHIETYQVTTGTLSRNETYTGLALHEDFICKAESNGYINYYAREGSKINASGVVYGLSMTETPQSNASISKEDLMQLRRAMQSFSKGFDTSRFNSTYSFKSQIEGSILQYVGVTAVSSALNSSQSVIDEDTGEDPDAGTADTENGSDLSAASDKVANSAASVVMLGNQTLCKSLYDGIVLYSKDGFEDKTKDNLELSDFNQGNYHETDLKTKGFVTVGEDIYTIVTDENWSLFIPLTDRQMIKLKDRDQVRVKFLKDGYVQNGSFSVVQIGGQNYGRIDFDKGLIRYVADRFLDIELVTNTKTGLKIPLSSIVTKEFYVIPSVFALDDGESFNVEERGKDGSVVRRTVDTIVYASISDQNTTYASGSESLPDNTYLYVDKSAFKDDEILVNDKEDSRFVIGDTDVLEGVYCINKGYAVFRRIEVLDQNDEYAIVARDTDFGLVRYDHIVRDASSVKEQDILF